MALVPTPEPTKFTQELIGLKQQAVPLAVVQVNKKFPDALPIANILLSPPPSPFDILRNIIKVPVSTATPMQAVGTSDFGTDVYANLEIQATEWTDFEGRRRSFPDLTFNTVLLNVQQSKNIIETEIQGSDYGAVLEYVGMRNYDITCEMIITGENGIYPKEAVAFVKTMLTAPVPLKVNSWFLQQFDIYDLTVRDFTIPQVPGGISQQLVQITFSSNNSAILVIQ